MKQKTSLQFVVAAIILMDVTFVIVADLASFIIRFNGAFPESSFETYLNLAFFIAALRLLGFYIFHLYDKPKYKSNFETFINTVRANTASSVIIVFIIYFLDITTYPRSLIFLSWLLTTVFISTWRLVIKDFIELYLGKDFLRAHLLIIGIDARAQDVASRAMRDVTINYKFIGFLDPMIPVPARVKKEEILGTIDDLPHIVKKYPINEVIIADPDLDSNVIARMIRILAPKKIQLKSIPDAYETVISNMVLFEQGIPFVGPTLFTKPSSWYWGLKRILDIVLSVVLLLITFPIMLATVILIKLTSPGPIMYLQKRIGQNGKRFIMYKFRTMYIHSEKGGHPKWAKKDDIRITFIGRILRPLRIDELPQLVNVLKNDMSLIGPRPERPYFTSQLIKKIPFYAERLQVKPGITGWAQVNFRYTDTIEDTEQKLLYDLFYIQNISLALDFLIFMKTIQVVLSGKGAH